jgi:tRNA (mo5U34)-methyltransferase
LALESLSQDPSRLLKHATPELRSFLTQEIREAQERLLAKALQTYREDVSDFIKLAPNGVILGEEKGMITIGSRDDLSEEQHTILQQLLSKMNPWRKGPFSLFGEKLDAEWQSNQKWDRLKPHLPPLWGKKVLDVGCNNGYYLLHMAQEDPEWLLGIDPTPRFLLQWRLLTGSLQLPRVDFHLLGQEHLQAFPKTFDIILSLGILYHHPEPLSQLKILKKALKPGGWLVLEGMGIDSQDPISLFPHPRYAKAPGVWFLPSVPCLENWLTRSGFREVRVLHTGPTTPQEQRNTHHCPRPFESLSDFLHPNDSTKTVEGYPAPWRYLLMAR